MSYRITSHETNSSIFSSEFASGILSLEDARNLYESMEKEIILRNYKFPDKPSSDGYYHINIAGRTEGRGQFKAKSLERLKEKVYAYEKGINGHARKRFKEVFEMVQERKLSMTKDNEKRLSVSNTVNKNKQDYKRFFQGTDFEQLFVDTIRPKDIEEIYQYNLSKYNLRKKAALAMRGIIKNVMLLALRQEWIEKNPYLSADFGQFKDMIEPDSITEERGYTEQELEKIHAFIAEKQKKKPDYFPAYALELQIMCGLRRGEVPPLMWEDFHDGYMDIHREQITVQKTAKEPEHDAIVSHTKTWKDRHYPITTDVSEFLKRLRMIHKAYGIKSEYLFPAPTETKVISNNTVYNFYRRMCEKLGIVVRSDIVRGTHAFRRNAITQVINQSNGNILMASKLFGNTPAVINQNYYTGLDLEKAKEVFEAF